MAQTKRKSSELLEHINQLTPQDCSNQFKLRSLLRDAEQLAGLPNAELDDHIVLGIAHALNFNTDQSDEIFNSLLRQTPEPVLFKNYATILTRTNRPQQAINTLQAGLSHFPQNPDLLNSLAKSAFIAGNLAITKQISIDNANKEIQPLVRETNAAISFLDRHNINQEALINSANVLHKLLQEEQILNPRHHEVRIEVEEDEETEWLLYEVSLNISVEKSVTLDNQLNDRLIENDMITGPYEHIVLMTACIEPENAS